ncbi:MAG: tetratricopeptide repeat protein, partial [Myxococcales bacterium]|nr:tetratricopeptide repeat protein [Myxococcales bacterium]
MFRLAELYYTTSRTLEQRAYDRRDQAYAVRERNPAQSRHLEQMADDDLAQADLYATSAVEQYAELYQEYSDTYPHMDAVLYYLGATLSSLGRTEDALSFFEELANDYPDSSYLPRALLAFGEYHFARGEMQQAQVFYEAVAQFPDSEIYAYALYQEAWCLYNTDSHEDAMRQLILAIQASSDETAGAIRMRTRALEDLALFYVEVGSAADAFYFFEQVAPADQVREMVELVASIFSEDGDYESGNSLWRELMERYPDSFQIVRYQSEIVRNTLPQPEGESEEQHAEAIVREIRRLVQIYERAKDFPDADPEAVQEAASRLEYQVRLQATTFHREAQVLNNQLWYAMAYNLYGDYVNHFLEVGEPDTAYTMAYYYAELLYRNERYQDAAQMWERCLDMNPDGEYTEEAVYKAVLAYTKLVDLETEAPVLNASNLMGENGQRPDPMPLPDVIQDLLRASDRYMSLNPPDEFAVEVKYVAAHVLYEYGHFEEASERFADVAQNYATVDGERARNSSMLLIISLIGMGDLEGAEEWIRVLRDSPAATVDFRDELEGLGVDIAFFRCSQFQEREDFNDAALCYFELFQTYPNRELADDALFYSANAFQQDRQFARAIRVREVLLQYHQDSEFAEDTRLALAGSFQSLALYRDAAQRYEEFASRHSEHADAQQALRRAAAFRQGLGEYEQAIADYETYIELYSDLKNECARSYFQIGDIYEDQGYRREAIAQYRGYLDGYAEDGAAGLAVHAATRLGVLYYDEGRDR